MISFTINDQASGTWVFSQLVVSDASVLAFVFRIDPLDRQSGHTLFQFRHIVFAETQ